MIDIHSLTRRYSVRPLDEQDIPLILKICQGNPLFYEYAAAECTAEQLKEDIYALPKGKTADDKYYFGFFDGNRLTAVMDLIDGYPDRETAFIGFFMMNADDSGKGTGTRIIGDVLSSLKEQGFAKVRLCINDGNPQSSHFWQKNGFIPVQTVQRGEETIILAEQKL